MAAVGRSVATLRFFGDDLVPDEISSLLGGAPTWSARKGEVVPSKSPGGFRTVPTGCWCLEATETLPGDVDAQVSELLAALTQDLAVWSALAARFDVDLFCGWFMTKSNEGATVSPATLLELGQRGIELGLDIYGP
jgi:hypothetical protein